MKIPQQELNKRWEAASQEIRDEIFSFKNDVLVENIAQEYSLDKDQHEVLADTVLYVLLGFLQPKKSIDYIKEETNVTSQEAIDIFKKLEEHIFSRIEKELFQFSSRFHEGYDDEEVEEVKVKEEVSLQKDDQKAQAQEGTSPVSVEDPVIVDREEKPGVEDQEPQTPINTEAVPEEKVEDERVENQQEIPDQEPQESEVGDEPFIIHSTTLSSSQEEEKKPRIRRSLGGISGMGGSMFGSRSDKEKKSYSHAEVEVPSEEKKVKNVDYSDYSSS